LPEFISKIPPSSQLQTQEDRANRHSLLIQAIEDVKGRLDHLERLLRERAF
jgi:hypothetical protein